MSTQRFVDAFKKQASSRSSLIGKSRQDAFGQSFAADGGSSGVEALDDRTLPFLLLVLMLIIDLMRNPSMKI